MAEKRTAEDFERVLFRVEDNNFNIENSNDRWTAMAALLIAAAVMRPSVIEKAIAEHFEKINLNDAEYLDPGHKDEAEVVRAALTSSNPSADLPG